MIWNNVCALVVYVTEIVVISSGALVNVGALVVVNDDAFLEVIANVVEDLDAASLASESGVA